VKKDDLDKLFFEPSAEISEMDDEKLKALNNFHDKCLAYSILDF